MNLSTILVCFLLQLCQDVLVQLGKVLETYDDDSDTEVPGRSPSPNTSSNGHPLSVQNGQDSPENLSEGVPTETVCLTPEVMIIVCTALSLCTKRLEKQGNFNFPQGDGHGSSIPSFPSPPSILPSCTAIQDVMMLKEVFVPCRFFTHQHGTGPHGVCPHDPHFSRHGSPGAAYLPHRSSLPFQTPSRRRKG